jgi:excinuclease UvrABC ATPase subunit
LNIGRKTEAFTEGQGSWRKILLNNDRRELKRMVEYCRNDVAGLLEPVWERLSLTCPAATHAGVVSYREKWSCPRCASEKVRQHQRRVTARGTLQFQMHCVACGSFYLISESVKKKYLEEKKAP